MGKIYALVGNEATDFPVVDIYDSSKDEPLRGFIFNSTHDAEEFSDFINENANHIKLLLS